MTQQEVIDLMKSSKSSAEWNINSDKVKEVFHGYPNWWYSEIILSGIADDTLRKWGSSTAIKFKLF